MFCQMFFFSFGERLPFFCCVSAKGPGHVSCLTLGSRPLSSPCFFSPSPIFGACAPPRSLGAPSFFPFCPPPTATAYDELRPLVILSCLRRRRRSVPPCFPVEDLGHLSPFPFLAPDHDRVSSFCTEDGGTSLLQVLAKPVVRPLFF